MDENFCENETSESVDGQKAKETENPPRLEIHECTFERKNRRNEISNNCGTSLDASVSGPSTDSPLVRPDNKQTTKSVEEIKPTAPVEGSSVEEPPVSSAPVEEPPMPSIPVREPPVPPIPVERLTEFVRLSRPIKETNASTSPLICVDEQPRVRLAPEVERHLGSRKPSLGPPPSYSFVMKQKKKLKSVPSPDPTIVNRTPPPTYTGTRGVYMAPEERMCAYPSFADPVWRSHSQAALCPRCGILVLTTTHAHDSIATHVTALALCLFGCWPCCLLPYCINGCKNMYHYCPICQTFLGLYRPW